MVRSTAFGAGLDLADVTRTLPEPHAARLADALRPVRAGGDDAAFADDATAAVLPHLPAEVLHGLLGLRDPGAPGVLLVRGLPVDRDLPPTPTDRGRGDPRGLAPVATGALVGTTRLLGEPYGYRGEYHGDLVTHVLPTRAAADAVSSSGARAVLPHHSESVHLHPHSPDFVALLCLRGDPTADARTSVVAAGDVCARLPEDVLEVLRLPLFHVRAPLSFGGRTMGSGPIPLISGPSSAPEVHAEFADMRGIDDRAQRAMTAFEQQCGGCATQVALEAGDLLVLDNRKVLHGRSSFAPQWRGLDRWCLRVLVRSGDLWSSRVYLDGRHRLVF